ncbi:hypothetical protein ID866_5416 [Astraeus odoratus]|nr:hypothetical protein ID866_5416 [Astraeus odoratus]
MTLVLGPTGEPEEQDIGLYYSSRPSSVTISDGGTLESGACTSSRPTSQAYFELSSPVPSSLKSTSMTNVVERQPVHHQKTLSRSHTLPRLTQGVPRHESTDVATFDFPDSKVFKMRQWVLAFVVVDFDIDLGPVVRAVCPPVFLSPSEKENIVPQHCKLSPSPGATIELGFLGSVLHVELPTSLDSQQLAETASFNQKFDPMEHVLASSVPFDPPPISLFEASLSHLWSVWECLVLCEPILVFGPSPSMTSQTVWWLRDLMRPIPLAGDIRPYFTIHDKDHALLVNKAPPKPGLIIGVTNPFFEKSCGAIDTYIMMHRHGAATVVTGPSAGWTTKTHRRYISKDRQLLKRLEKACAGNASEKMHASLDLRRHFCSRTNAVLVPLNRYLNALIPSPAERDASGSGVCQLKPFNSTDFFASLRSNPSALPFKSSAKQREFYERWLKTPAFGLWLARQAEVVQDVLRQKR